MVRQLQYAKTGDERAKFGERVRDLYVRACALGSPHCANLISTLYPHERDPLATPKREYMSESIEDLASAERAERAACEFDPEGTACALSYARDALDRGDVVEAAPALARACREQVLGACYAYARTASLDPDGSPDNAEYVNTLLPACTAGTSSSRTVLCNAWIHPDVYRVTQLAFPGKE